MKKLYFVRHGLSVANIDGIWSGQLDTPLSDAGGNKLETPEKQPNEPGLVLTLSSARRFHAPKRPHGSLLKK